MFIINWGDVEGRLDPYYHSGYISGFINHLTYTKERLHNVIEYYKNGFAAGYNEQARDIEKAILQIRPTNFDKEGNFKFGKNIYIENVDKDDILKQGEVLFNNTNSQELVGKSVYFDLEGKYCCSNHITRLMPKQEIVYPQYLKEILNIYFRNKIFFHLCTNWNNQSGINYSVLKKLLVPVPNKDIQHQIIDLTDSAYAKERELEQQADELLKSIDTYLLDKLGIAIPTNPNDSLENRMFFVKSESVIDGRFDPKKYSEKYRYIAEAIKTLNLIK